MADRLSRRSVGAALRGRVLGSLPWRTCATRRPDLRILVYNFYLLRYGRKRSSGMRRRPLTTFSSGEDVWCRANSGRFWSGPVTWCRPQKGPTSRSRSSPARGRGRRLDDEAIQRARDEVARVARERRTDPGRRCSPRVDDPATTLARGRTTRPSHVDPAKYVQALGARSKSPPS